MVISRRTLALAAALGTAACSSYNRATISGDAGATPELPVITLDAPAVDAPSPPVDSGATTDFSCQRLCGRLQGISGCTMVYNGCLSMCATETRGFPASCRSRFEALFQCVETTPAARISCGSMAYPYTDCMMLNGDALSCARTAP
ncbi:MAG: hypothetical protein Q8S73_35350 [Deltaproteobacteria bacterium]|nr:hypothetical protein [Myxococcales bacterium]MDP3219431.1 hypothetical protein [Deltaproteobacteria bacterium]